MVVQLRPPIVSACRGIASFFSTEVPAEDKRTGRVQQMLVDPEDHNDWVAEFEVDLALSRTANEPSLRLKRVGSL